MVVHYQFEGITDWERIGNEKDVQQLKKSFNNANRFCNFVELTSPRRKYLLENLQDEQKLCQQFGLERGCRKIV